MRHAPKALCWSLALLTIIPAASLAMTPVEDPVLAKVDAALAEVLAEPVKGADAPEPVPGAPSGPGIQADCPSSSAPADLTLGVGVVGTALSTSTADDCHYRVTLVGDVTGKRLRVNVSNTVSDHDLFVKQDVVATVSPYACSALGTQPTFEQCIADWPLVATDYYVRVHRFSSTASDFTLTVFLEDAVNTCSLGFVVTPLTDALNATASVNNTATGKCMFSFGPNPAFDGARFNITPTGGVNVDLRVRKDAFPSSTSSDCSSSLSGTTATDTCFVQGAGSTFYAMVHRPSATGAVNATFNIRAVFSNTCSLGPVTTPLVNGVATSAALTGDTGASCTFSFLAPPTEDTVKVVMAPPTGSNFDLYVRRGAAPTTTTYDCRPLSGTSITETCLTANDGQVVYVMVRRSSGSGTFNVTATAFSPCSLGNGDTILNDGEAKTGALTADAGASCFFTFTNASPFDMAAFEMTPASGDFDLFVKVGARPTTTSNDCKSILVGAATAEACEAGGEGVTFFAMVSRVSGSGDFSITARSASSCGLGPGVHDLAAAATVNTTVKGITNGKCYFAFTHSPAADFASFVMDPAASDFDLYVKKGALPTTTSYDCRPFSGGTTVETCNMLIEDGTAWNVMVRRFSGVTSTFDLTATNLVLPTLESGVPVTVDVGAGQFQYFKVVLPAEAVHLTVAMVGDPVGPACVGPQAPLCNPVTSLGGICQAGPEACGAYNEAKAALCPNVPEACKAIPTTNADLYVRHISDARTPRGLPTTSLYTCRSNNANSVEACVFDTQLNDALGQVVGAIGPLPALPPPLPGLTVPDPVQPNPGPGKYFVAVRGVTGASTVVLGALYAPFVPSAPAVPDLPPLPPV